MFSNTAVLMGEGKEHGLLPDFHKIFASNYLTTLQACFET